MQTDRQEATAPLRGRVTCACRAARRVALGLAILPAVAAPCLAADPAGGHAGGHAGGAAPGLLWGIPFVGVLLSIAVLPMLAPRLWHRHMGLVALFWCLALLLPEAAAQGVPAAAATAWHAVLIEYLPFVTLLLALYTAAGGILLRGGPGGTPFGNTALLALGTLMAGLMGTTGAAMVLINPLLRANAHRGRTVHLVVFFILLVANIGGATSPLGDPPLYIGFLRGVPFHWPLLNLFAPMVWMAAPLLAAFYLLDRRLARGDPPPRRRGALRLTGWPNAVLVLVVVATVLGQGVVRAPEVTLFGQAIGAERLVGIVVFLAVAGLSLRLTPGILRAANDFSWHPMVEVATLFAAIFVTIAPVGAMLHAGFDGPAAPLLRLTQDAAGEPIPWAYFWLTGTLSAFLDNAPTYLVFFQLAGIDPAHLEGHAGTVLVAISSAAVFFGALTYIGNAPNMMVRAIARHRGVRMPGFFGYLFWASAALLPVLALVTLRFLIWY
jgi:Na+/H+ antiporter NhaD/arsenite permease-like protein